jgi:ferritin
METPKSPNTLIDSSVEIINNRISDEYKAHFFYTNAKNWCGNANYKKATKFFEAEAASELEHAYKLQQYLVDWNIDPQLPAVKPNITFTSLIDIINKAYLLEYNLFDRYNKDSKDLFTSDLATFDLFTEFRKLQTESVIEYSDLLNAAKLVNVDNQLDVLYFENKYFK